MGRWSVGRWLVVLVKPKLYGNISDIYTRNYLQHLNNDKLFYQLSRTSYLEYYQELSVIKNYLQQLNDNKLFYQLLISKLKNIIKYFFIKK